MVFYKVLADKRKNECQQCKNEHPEGNKIFEIKIVHQHHPHSMYKMEVSHPVTRLFTLKYNIAINCLQALCFESGRVMENFVAIHLFQF